MIILCYLKYFCYHRAQDVDHKRRYIFSYDFKMNTFTFHSQIIIGYHIYTMGYEVDFEKGITLCDVEKGSSKFTFKRCLSCI